MHMRTIGIRTFKNEATSLLSADEALVIERHGTPIGIYIPLAAKDRATKARSLADFGSYLQHFLTTHGLTEEELVRALATPDTPAEPEAAADAPGR
jgi:hypothetical protein